MHELLTSFGVDWKVMFLQSVNFFILFVIIYKFLAKPLNDLIEARRKKIEEGLKLREESRLMIAKIKKLRNKILTKAQLEREEIIKSAYKQREELLRKFNEEIVNLREEFNTQFEIEKQRIKEQFYQELKKEVPYLLEKFAQKVFRRSDLNKDYIEKLTREDYYG
jgi:F-type H+-transporting ATPase subunit b